MFLSSLVRADAPSARSLWLLFVGALALRLVALAAVPLHAPHPGVERSVWHWGAEPASLAESLHEGRGYGDPWGKDTGPSGWLTPVYPGLVSLLMDLTGEPRPLTAILLYVLQSAASAWTCVLLARLGAALGHAWAGLLGAAAFALDPISIWHSIHTVWDTTWVAMGITWLVLVLVRLHSPPRRGELIATGLGYGALLFMNPAPLAMAPVIVWYLWRVAPNGRAALANVGTVIAAAAIVCLPWMIRNQLTIQSFSLRPNFGVEMMIGNYDEATGFSISHVRHPSNQDEELDLYRRLGEAAYSQDAMHRATDWIRANPARFARLTLRRVQLFWMGEVPWLDPRTSGGRGTANDPASWFKFLSFTVTGVLALVALFLVDLRREQRLLIAGVLALFGVPYFLTHVSERYRFPVDSLLVLLGAILLIRAWESMLARRRAVRGQSGT